MLMCSCPILQQLDYTKQFLLATDASAYGVGAVLLQDSPPPQAPLVSHRVRVAHCSSPASDCPTLSDCSTSSQMGNSVRPTGNQCSIGSDRGGDPDQNFKEVIEMFDFELFDKFEELVENYPGAR